MGKDSKKTPMPLYSNVIFSSSVPNRATSRQENDFIVAIRTGIQNYVRDGGDYSKTIVIDIDFHKIAEEKGVKYIQSLQRSFQETLNNIKNLPLTYVIKYISSDGDIHQDTYWMLSSFKYNKSKGIITVKINPEFQEYYISEILRHPEIQIDTKFYATCKSLYTYHFVEWLSSQVAYMKMKDMPYPYHVKVSYDELRVHVPTPLKNGKPTLVRPNDYKRNAIEKAIEDVNTNPYSQLIIDNASDIVSKLELRRIAEFCFVVSFRPRTKENDISLLVGKYEPGLIDDAGIPPWEYLKEKMVQLGFSQSVTDKWQQRRGHVWRALLLTWLGLSKLKAEGKTDINAGGYLQALLKSGLKYESFQTLASKVIVKAPEYRDEVVDATADYQSPYQAFELARIIDENKRVEPQTVENNIVLKKYEEKHGRLPNFLNTSK